MTWGKRGREKDVEIYTTDCRGMLVLFYNPETVFMVTGDNEPRTLSGTSGVGLGWRTIGLTEGGVTNFSSTSAYGGQSNERTSPVA